MKLAKDTINTLEQALAARDLKKIDRARNAFASLLRTQLALRNSKSRENIGAIYADLANIPQLWGEMPSIEQPVSEFALECEISSGISLVTCCMNRNDQIALTAPSWLRHPEIDEIIIVDWSSSVPVDLTLSDAGVSDPRIRIVRVEDEGSWVLSHAYNVGFRASKRSTILKVDSDIVLENEFFVKNPIEKETFIAGNWRTADIGQSHVNGFFIVERDKLFQVNGFNENIVTYGWDDDDLYERLANIGVKRVDVSQDTIRHLDHEDARRTCTVSRDNICAWAEIETMPTFWTCLNKTLSESSAPWGPANAMSRFDVLKQTDQKIELGRRSPFGVDPSLIGTRRERIDAAVHALQNKFPYVVINPKSAGLDNFLARKSLKEIVKQYSILDRIPNAVASPMPHHTVKRKLIVDAQHGLGNRLRAIASAAAIAEQQDRHFIIRWVRDEHCDCDLRFLFDYEGPVETETPEQTGDVLNFDLMSKSERESFKVEAIRDIHRDITIKSAYRIDSSASVMKQGSVFLQSLKPASDVLAMIDTVRANYDIAAHVRMNGGAMTDEHGDVAGEWSKEEDNMARRARNRSHYGFFFKRIDELLSDRPDSTIYVASDNAESYRSFYKKYGDRVSWLERLVFDRSAVQLKYALADMIILSRSPILLGSSWSSFTEVAHDFSQNQKIEYSGIDF